MSERLFKVLGHNNEPVHGGKGSWTPGRWMPPVASIRPCKRGYHLCREQDLVLWLGPTIYEAKWRGERIDGDDKIVVSEARTIRRLTTWNERTQRLFAADCAESVVGNIPGAKRGPFVEAIRVARLFADGGVSEGELSAAESAAWSAAYWAAGSAAESAAESAAGSAAWSAAGSAARSAERRKQTSMLMGYLYPKEEGDE